MGEPMTPDRLRDDVPLAGEDFMYINDNSRSIREAPRCHSRFR